MEQQDAELDLSDMGINHKGRKPLPPGKKKTETIFARCTEEQYRMFVKLGDRYWLRKVLSAEIEKTKEKKE